MDDKHRDRKAAGDAEGAAAQGQTYPAGMQDQRAEPDTRKTGPSDSAKQRSEERQDTARQPLPPEDGTPAAASGDPTE